MAEDLSDPANQPGAPPAGSRLDSWKAIAAYLQRDVTTVRRWEKREGLPVHRHLHDKLGSVYAYRDEIDRWWQQRRLLNDGDRDSSATVVDVTGWASRRERLAWAFAGGFLFIALAASSALLVTAGSRTPAAALEHRFSIAPPESTAFGSIAVSPDGRHIAFAAGDAGGTRLWVRPLDSLTPRSLAGTDDAAFPFWSSDGRRIGFFAHGKLKTIDATGGSVQTVCDAPDGRGGTWNQDDVILFAPGREGPLLRVPASGGMPAPVTTVHRPAHRGHLWPEFLPDGRHFLYLADSEQSEHHGIHVGSLNGPATTRLVTAPSNAAYAGGYLLYVSRGALMAQRFDPGRLELGSETVILEEQVVQPYSVDHKSDFSASLTGVVAYRSGGSGLSRLVWVNRRGEPAEVVEGDPARYTEPVLSPDGRRAAVSVFSSDSRGLTSDIWLLDLVHGGRSRFTFDSAAEFEAVWSPDGARIVFASTRSGSPQLYQKSASGSGTEEPLLTSEGSQHPEAWSPDGRFLVYSTFHPRTKFDLSIVSVTGNREAKPYLRTEFSEGQSQISPDGKWLAYTSNESGRWEVYVRGFPVPDGKWHISSAGGADPRWRRDGRELFYIAADGRLMALATSTDGVFEAGVPRPLFDTNVKDLWEDARNHYDVSGDGERFLMAVPIENVRSLPLTVVVNWPARLRE